MDAASGPARSSKVATRCASGSRGACAESGQVTRPGSAAGPAGGTRPAGVGTVRRGPLLQSGGLGRRVGEGCGCGAGAEQGGGASGRATPRADCLCPGARHAEWTDCFVAHPGIAGCGCGVLLHVFLCRVTRAESEPRADSRWLPGPSPLGLSLRDSHTPCQRLGSVREGATEGFVNGAAARRLRLADAKGLVS